MLERRRAPVLCVSILALALPACLHAQEAPLRTSLATGISQIQARDFVNALVTLNDVVAQQANRPEQAATLATAHAYRAAAFIGLEQPEWARGAALEALKADPRIVVTAAAFGPRVAALFESARNPSSDPEAAGQTAEAAGRFQDAFLGYLSALQALPDPPPPAADQRLRERIIKVVRKVEPKPSVPEGARALLAQAEALLNAPAAAGTPSKAVAEQAAMDLRHAVRLAPWWPDATVRLAVVLQGAERVDEATLNLLLYQLITDDGSVASVAATSAASAASREAAAVSPGSAPSPNVNAPARIYVYFPHTKGPRGFKAKLLCDGTRVADLAHEHYIVLNAVPGVHNVEFMGENASGSFAGGQEHYVRVGVEGRPAHVALRIIEAAQAAAEIRDQPVLPNEAKNTFTTECKPVAAAKPRTFR